ncbi:MAG: KilA-N domain-containing protein [Comamonadaceae bacterium]|nr:KilA-N domain-containing protein [Comamonadaceae bacterium]
MSKDKKITISVQGTAITVMSQNKDDFISLTDMSRKFGDDTLIYSWMRNRNTLEFLGIWEQIHNPGFNSGEFETFKKEAGLNSFHLTPKKWIDATHAIGIQSRAGRYGGGTFAHKDLAFEFGTWLSPEFKLYLIKEFQRLKDDESQRLSLEWNFQRTLSKVNYKIHTDAIKERLIPAQLTAEQKGIAYASEADLLNVALFGITAKQWRDANPEQPGNMRDTATLEQLVVLSNLESINAMLIHQGQSAPQRLLALNTIAITQMRSLVGLQTIKQLGVR